MKENPYKSILVIVVGLWLLQRYFHIPYLEAVSLSIGIISVLWERMAYWIHWGWMKLAEMLGYVNSRILLGIIFYVFLFPLALLARLFGKDTLLLRQEKKDTTFLDRDHSFVPQDFENVW